MEEVNTFNVSRACPMEEVNKFWQGSRSYSGYKKKKKPESSETL